MLLLNGTRLHIFVSLPTVCVWMCIFLFNSITFASSIFLIKICYAYYIHEQTSWVNFPFGMSISPYEKKDSGSSACLHTQPQQWRIAVCKIRWKVECIQYKWKVRWIEWGGAEQEE